MNLFRYCGDEPVDKSDPTGIYNVVQHEAGSRDYVVQIPIQYTGPGNTAGARAEYSKGIESLSGAYKGEVNGKSVDINVTFKVTEPKQGELKNTVYVREGVGGKGFGLEAGTNKAVWYAGGGRYPGQDISAADGARHSVGHFLGLRDRYDPATGVTYRGCAGHLMDWRPGGTLGIQDVNRVVNLTWWGQTQLEWGNYP
jgi:hypothetical protein